ncbi:MAG TPA: hypothetical protein VHP81_00975 [Lachnospiraceae bacterium]|nr:hypothetical protein [Lachnospiraceae bacterium]
MRRRKIIRDYVVASLALSMLIVFWMFCIDAFLYGEWGNLKVIVSIVIYAFLICLLQRGIQSLLDRRPILSILSEYVICVFLFFVFGVRFNWYPKGGEWLVILYSIPVFIVGYLLRLLGVSKDADYINSRLSKRRKKDS